MLVGDSDSTSIFCRRIDSGDFNPRIGIRHVWVRYIPHLRDFQIKKYTITGGDGETGRRGDGETGEENQLIVLDSKLYSLFLGVP